MTTIHRLAVVNRGEAAMRCLSAVAELNCESGEPIDTIALYTEPDADVMVRPGGDRGGFARGGHVHR